MKTLDHLTLPLAASFLLALGGCDDSATAADDGPSTATDTDATHDAGDPPADTGEPPEPTDGGSTGDTGEVPPSTGDAGETTGGADDESTGSTGEEPVEFSECDPWNADDCSDGFKCMPYDSPPIDLIWDANGCFPVSGQEHSPGDECTVYDSAVDGIDSCDGQSMCLPYDFEELSDGGTCIAFCKGGSDAPWCESATDTCVIANEGVLNLCLAMCDPVLQNCGEGQGCYLNPTDGKFFCFDQDADAAEAASDYEAPCGTINFCDPGLQCGEGSNVPDCSDAYCCTEYCDLSDPAGDEQCTGYAEGQVCTAHFPEGEEPPGFEDVGLCAIPQ